MPPDCTSAKWHLTPDNEPRQTRFCSAPTIPTQIDVLLVLVTERNAEKRRRSAFYNLPRVACREERTDWSESDSSIQPLYGKFHALCLPVGGASLANDDVMRGCRDRNVA